jgi:hypothetical protein
LSQTRSGHVIAKPLAKKQQEYLQSIPKDKIAAYIAEGNIAKPLAKKQRDSLKSIPKDTIAAYLADRKYDLQP